MFQDILATNGQARVYNQNATTFILNYISGFNTDLQNFLSVHSDNTAIYDNSFNSFFNGLIYTSVCESIDGSMNAAQKAECPIYLGGILEKGLYSANLAYWDNIREMMNAFLKSN